MNVLSVCSGIGTPELAWSHLGWHLLVMCEVERFPRRVLKTRFRAIDQRKHLAKGKGCPMLWGDFTTLRPRHLRRTHGIDTIDFLVGGTPCQSFSVAGKRAGLDDPRGNLALEFAIAAFRFGARWVVWENVPGVLSSKGGEDFAAILSAFSGRQVYPEGGWENSGIIPEASAGHFGIAWRVLDAQHFGVPQRRRRVFLVGYLGDWRRAAAVLLEWHSLSGNSAPSRKQRQDVAGTIGARTQGGGGLGTDFDLAGGVIPVGGIFDNYNLVSFGGGNTSGPIDIATACNAHGGVGSMDFDTETFVTAPLTQNPYADNESRESLLIAFSAKDHGMDAGETAPTLRAGGHSSSHANAGVMPAIASQMSVRRLTPKECERLQGLPDGWTDITVNGKPAADGPRYKAIGNGMAEPCIRWIGERIQMVEAIEEA